MVLELGVECYLLTYKEGFSGVFRKKYAYIRFLFSRTSGLAKVLITIQKVGLRGFYIEKDCCSRSISPFASKEARRKKRERDEVEFS